jgi:hypothetical protein
MAITNITDIFILHFSLKQTLVYFFAAMASVRMCKKIESILKKSTKLPELATQ